MSVFDIALEHTLRHEGETSNLLSDPGGLTYKGISRVYWPNWEGWKYLDRGEVPPEFLVREFYRINFWDRIWGDNLSTFGPNLAAEVFDTAVNLSVTTATKMLQEALNLLNSDQDIYADVVVDGKLGPMTLSAVTDCCVYGRKNKLMKVLNILQGEHYINLMRRHPEKEEFSGWFNRT